MRQRYVWATFPLSLAFLTAATAALVALSAVLLATGPLGSIWQAYSYLILAGFYTGAGLFAWWRRPVNRLGPLLIFGGAAWLAGSLQNTGLAPLIGIGQVSATLPLSVVVHLLHAVPSGRLRDRASRITVAYGYVVGVLLEVPLWAFTPEPHPFDVVMISARPDLALRGYHLQEACGIVLVLVTLVLLTARLREYDAHQRRVLAPLFVYGLVALLAIPLGSDLLLPMIGLRATVALQLIALSGLPISFVAVVFRGGFARTTELGALVTSVATSSGSHRELQEAVARTLGDPSASVLSWSADRGYADVAGGPATLPQPGGLRATTLIAMGERRMGALVYDAQLTVDHALPAAIARVAAIALDREQLAIEASESRASLQLASSRLLDESDRTRRGIARDLHDGLQAALVALSLQAHLVADDSSSAESRAMAAELAVGVDRAAVSLRALVEGVMPPHLLERGLADAVRELAHHLPLRVQLDVEHIPSDLPPPVESTAYFVVAEALTNVVKHAQASRVHVTLAGADDVLHIDVTDDGRGGAQVARAGVGLRSLQDRVRVLGGTLEVTSGSDGTRLEVQIPCGS